MDFEMLLKTAHWLGWRPADLWSATLWELETAVLAQIQSTRPPPTPEAAPEEVLAAFRALPDHQILGRA